MYLILKLSYTRKCNLRNLCSKLYLIKNINNIFNTLPKQFLSEIYEFISIYTNAINLFYYNL